MFKPTFSMDTLLRDLQKLENERNKIQQMVDGEPMKRANQSLRTMMDRYDIRDAVKGKDWTQSPIADGVILPNISSDGLYGLNSTSIWNSVFPTYGGINRAPQFGFTGWRMMDPDPEAERKAKEQREHDLREWKGHLTAIGEAPAVKLENPEPKKPKQHRSPDYVQTMIGWRAWSSDGNILEALGSDHQWKPKKIVQAECSYHDHEAPQMSCACGYWSFKTPELMKEACFGYKGDVAVVGSVEIWGRVIECQNGYRSEYAYPKELWLLEEGLERLSWIYGVPVRQLK